jgi:hypothetical protein
LNLGSYPSADGRQLERDRLLAVLAPATKERTVAFAAVLFYIFLFIRLKNDEHHVFSTMLTLLLWLMNTRLLSILLGLVFTLPFLLKVAIVIDFKVNQNYIAQVLCINKDKPVLKCNGSCHLSKQLKTTEKNEEQHIPQSLKTFMALFFNVSIENVKTTFGNVKLKSHFTPYFLWFSNSTIHSVFHPPKF